MHYFPTRAVFVTEAVRHVAAQLAGETASRTPPRAQGDRRRFEWVLNELWSIHAGPAFQATMELWVAARTDPEVRDALGDVARDVTGMIALSARELYPDLIVKRGANAVLDTSLAAIRGLAILRFHGDPHVERRWAATRRHLLALYDEIADAPAAGARPG
jgi:hypothetical protein